MNDRDKKFSLLGFTPGPWRTGRTDMRSYDGAGEPFSSVYCDDASAGRHLGRQLPLRVATVHGVNLKREEEKANAHLIAAAPELYYENKRALKKLRDVKAFLEANPETEWMTAHWDDTECDGSALLDEVNAQIADLEHVQAKALEGK